MPATLPTRKQWTLEWKPKMSALSASQPARPKKKRGEDNDLLYERNLEGKKKHKPSKGEKMHSKNIEKPAQKRFHFVDPVQVRMARWLRQSGAMSSVSWSVKLVPRSNWTLKGKTKSTQTVFSSGKKKHRHAGKKRTVQVQSGPTKQTVVVKW